MSRRIRLAPAIALLSISLAADALAATPGEATQLIVTGRDAGSGALSIGYEPACSATDHHIEFGLLENLGSGSYSGQICAIGNSGTHTGFNPGSGSYFFLVVGHDGDGREGSYGTATVGGLHAERPEDLTDASCVFVQELSERCDIPTVELTAYRPQSEFYGAPFLRRAIPDELEFTPGVGIRVNGDDDNGNGSADANDGSVIGENDLIEITLATSMPMIPDGLEYVLIRIDGDARVWDSATKGVAIVGAAESAPLSFAGGPITAWVEKPDVGSSRLTLAARRTRDGSIVASDELSFFAFGSIVIALGGEDQVPADPPLAPGNHGTFAIAIDLYELGYDVHMYDEDVVTSNGSGAAYNEVVRAVRDRAVESIAIYGYSHGAGSTNDLAIRLDDNRATIGNFSIDFTGYVDAINNTSDIDIFTETALPQSTAYHANYYEHPGCGLFSLCGGPIAGADFDLNVTSTPWGAGLTHFTIDDAPDVKLGLMNQLIMQVTP